MHLGPRGGSKVTKGGRGHPARAHPCDPWPLPPRDVWSRGPRTFFGRKRWVEFCWVTPPRCTTQLGTKVQGPYGGHRAHFGRPPGHSWGGGEAQQVVGKRTGLAKKACICTKPSIQAPSSSRTRHNNNEMNIWIGGPLLERLGRNGRLMVRARLREKDRRGRASPLRPAYRACSPCSPPVSPAPARAHDLARPQGTWAGCIPVESTCFSLWLLKLASGEDSQ